MGLPLNIDWQQILLHLFNFLILAGGLYLLLYKPVKQFMDKREQTYQAMNDAADQKAQQAQQAQQQAAQRLEQLNKEIAKKNSEAAQQASLAAQKILDEAEAEKAHIQPRDRTAGHAGHRQGRPAGKQKGCAGCLFGQRTANSKGGLTLYGS